MLSRIGLTALLCGSATGAAAPTSTCAPPPSRPVTTPPFPCPVLSAVNGYYPSASGVTFPIFRYAIDSGYATGEVYTFVRTFGGERAVVIKGDSRAQAPISQPSPVDVGPQGKNVKFGVRVWPVNGSMIKEELYRWLRLDRPTEESGEPYPPGYCHFPKYSEEYFKQITAKQLVTKVVKGYRRTEWQKTRDRNESLDCRSYARAAAAAAGMDRYTDAMWKTIEDNVAERRNGLDIRRRRRRTSPSR
jgi:phage terminase large subunit GpA-like protein